MSIAFSKMNGLGNDFVVFDRRTNAFDFDVAFLQRVADRKRGVGCDQVIMIEPSAKADAFMRIYNPDGSQVEACGNATRCIGSVLANEKKRDGVTIETVVGVLTVTRDKSGMMTADMGQPKWGWQDIPLAREMDTLALDLALGPVQKPCCVNVGNPHAVFFVDDVASIDLAKWGPQLETHVLFPRKSNIEFVQVLSRAKVRMRVWERGAGITEACGTGSCATIVAAVRRGLTDRKVEIVMDGGSLFNEWREADNHIYMTGPASFSFNGMLD